MGINSGRKRNAETDVYHNYYLLIKSNNINSYINNQQQVERKE